MKKTFKIKNIDCANCAAELERKLSKIEGVSSVTLNFFAEKLTVEAEDSNFDDIMKKVKATANKAEPECEIS